jgi:hypothetical protein
VRDIFEKKTSKNGKIFYQATDESIINAFPSSRGFTSYFRKYTTTLGSTIQKYEISYVSSVTDQKMKFEISKYGACIRLDLKNFKIWAY